MNLPHDLNNLLYLLQSKQLSTSLDLRKWKFKQYGVITINSLYRNFTGYQDEIIASGGFGLLKCPSKPRFTCGSHFMNVS